MNPPCFLLLTFAFAAGGCVSPEGGVKRSSMNRTEPFRGLYHQRVVLLRPMPVRTVPEGMPQPYGDESGRVLPVPSSELDTEHFFLGVKLGSRAPAASARTSDDIAWTSAESKGGRRLSSSDLPRVLPKGTVIEFQKFERSQSFDAWLVPSPVGLFPYPPTYTATFTAPGVSPLPGTMYDYRWGFGPRLWAAPWEPKHQSPDLVGEMDDHSGLPGR